MSFRYFGEYLVAKKVISPQQLLDALLAQLTALPPVAELINQEKLLAPEALLAVLQLQQQEGLDFRGAARRLNLWDPQLEARLETRIQELRPALGQLLIQRQLLDLKALTRHLDDYLAQAGAPPAPAATPAPLPAALPESVSALVTIDAVIELRDLFDERKRRAVKVALSFIKDRELPDPATTAKLVADVRKILAPLAALAAGGGLATLGELLRELHALAERCEQRGFADVAFLRVFAASAAEGMEECWALREDLVATCDQSKLAADPPRQRRLGELLARLKELT